MKLTVNQLRKIIREEIQRTTHLSETVLDVSPSAIPNIAANIASMAGTGTPEDFRSVARAIVGMKTAYGYKYTTSPINPTMELERLLDMAAFDRGLTLTSSATNLARDLATTYNL
jgi:hypothetical protein